MSEPTHEEESLRTLTQAGILTAQVLRARFGGTGTSARMAAEVARLRAAGYTEQTPYDDLLRELLGEQRWAKYARDGARVAAAAAVTDADRAGIYDMEKLLKRAVTRRAWEDDPTSPARSVAEILHYRVTTEAARKHPSVMKRPPAPAQQEAGQGQRRPPDPRQPTPAESKAHSSRTDHGGSSGSAPVPGAAQPVRLPATPWDDTLRSLLGEDRWRQYAVDPRRRDVAGLLVGASIDGHDVDKLLIKVVSARGFEKDPWSPARRVAAVLHYRIESALAVESAAKPRTEVPGGVAATVSNAKAPPGTGPKVPAQADAARHTRPIFRTSRPPEGRDSR